MNLDLTKHVIAIHPIVIYVASPTCVLNSNNIQKSSHFIFFTFYNKNELEMLHSEKAVALHSCMKQILKVLAGNYISIIFNIYMKHIKLFKCNYLTVT